MKKQYLKCEGDFNFIAHKPESGWFGESGVIKTPFIEISLEVVDDPEEAGKFVTWYGYLSEKNVPGKRNALEITIETLTNTFGFDGDLNALYNGTTSFDLMPCCGTTAIETYEGKERVKICWLNPAGYQRGRESLDKGSITSLLSRINGPSKRIALAAQSVTKQPKAAVPAVKTGPSEDDVPF